MRTNIIIIIVFTIGIIISLFPITFYQTEFLDIFQMDGCYGSKNIGDSDFSCASMSTMYLDVGYVQGIILTYAIIIGAVITIIRLIQYKKSKTHSQTG